MVDSTPWLCEAAPEGGHLNEHLGEWRSEG